jgi:HK97 family phage major capsid protein
VSNKLATDTNIFWSDEQTGYQASPDPNLGMLEIFARELNGYIKISKQNLEDSVFDIEAFLLKRLSRQFAQKEGTAFISGNGVARPEGIITNAQAAGTGINILVGGDATTHTILPMDCVNLMHKVKSGYRATGIWLASNATIGALRLFRDSQKRPLWTMFGQDWMETLFGRPIVEMPDLKDPTSYQTDAAGGQAVYATNDMPLVFGDIGQAYQIVDRVGLTFQTLKELYAIQNQVAFLARQRVGGKVVLPEALAVLKIQ